MSSTLLYTEKRISSSYFGILFSILIAIAAIFIAQTSFVKSSGMSPVVIGIIMGIIFGNALPSSISEKLNTGTAFATKYILRTAIIFYGFRITFQNILEVGAPGLLVSFIMVISTLLLGIFLGKKLFGMDSDLALLTAAGSAICGAAAVCATESVLKNEKHKSVVAISTVVLFGTISMFLFPALYHSGILHMNSDVFGIFAGGSIHEVAQVVVAGNGANEAAANSAVIVKMTRVMLLVPVLIALGFFIVRKNKSNGTSSGKFPLPYFVLGFILAAGINSMNLFSSHSIETINTADTFLLTIAMCALGLETQISKFREAGTKPIQLAGILFLWLLFGGFFVTKLVTNFF
ncbi:MAG: YeiH family putative sulfate export transporter [Bacteroidetes bacterium]|nr:YeiH family putative sulfate export transporter [Bacteroidota bacterium]